MQQRHISRLVAAALALPMLAVMALPTDAAPVASLAKAGPVGQPADYTVTLVTGDQVLVHGDDIQPIPVKERAGIAYDISKLAGHTYVIPSDATPAIAAGLMDRRLFDITALQEFGYGQSAEIPLIVDERMQAAGLRTTSAITRSSKAVRAKKGTVWKALKGTRTKVWLDGKRQVDLAESVPQIGAPAAWQAGFTGKGVKVAVLDTGIDATHPDFEDRIADNRNFTNDASTDDTNGHGTHVASTIAGDGSKYRGVAPDATLAVGKVCESVGCYDSAILAGMDWAARDAKAQVVNMSLGAPNSPDIDPLEAEVDKLTAETGTLFVIAAGNSNGTGSVSSPSTADSALSVGAVDKNDNPAPYSNRGPRVPDGVIKPEIAAPGTAITAARATNSPLPTVDGQYTTASGTSMATPHVAGAAAVLAERRPEWQATELKSALVSSSTGQGDVNAVGAGRVDLAQAVQQDLYAVTSMVNFGLQSWPHSDDEPVSSQVTYRNTGSASITLSLSTSGSPFTPGQETVTIPAGGQAEATVIADTRTGPVGNLTGRLLATAEGVRIVIPLVVDSEVESYDLTIKQIGRDGKPAPIRSTLVVKLDSLKLDRPISADGTVTLRRPKGRYMIESKIFGDDIVSMVQPLLELGRDTTLTFDARDAKLVRPTVKGVGGGIALQDVGFSRSWDSNFGRAFFGGQVLQFGMNVPITPLYTVQYGPEFPKGELLSWVNYRIAEPGPAKDFTDSPYVYHLFWDFDGKYPTGLAPTVKRDELARVRQNFHAMMPNTFGLTRSWGGSAGRQIRSSVPLLVTLPFSRDEYYMAKEGRTWTYTFATTTARQFFPNLTTEEEYIPEALTPGKTTEKHWHRGVFGASLFKQGTLNLLGSYRDGDSMTITPITYSDGVAGRIGFPFRVLTTRTALYRDGVLVSANDDPWISHIFPSLPAEPSTYRLEVDRQLDRTWHPMSDRTRTVWTFRSAASPGKQALPLMVASISPELDSWNTAPANKPFKLPVTVTRNPGSASATVTSVKVETSFDDGKTWRRISVLPGGQGTYNALTTNPAPGGWASLRVTATDSAGGKVEQTIIHAYRIR
ncbi:S8 family peptidase [Nocardioides speluncae]|uniref:S8 family peptidase n=1 Tax=Nocardioides speluncae TaxID=2670337 RepID=UPI000D694A72|nr:S8 family serine peptidase [Nocardioides speluncae]